MSTRFIWLSTQTFRWHHCTSRAMLSVRDTEIATQTVFPQFEQFSYSLLRTILYRSERDTVLLLCDQVADFLPRQTGAVLLSFWWRHRSEIVRRIPTVRTAPTLRLRCVFCNSMQYSAICYVFIKENTQSYGTSRFSVKVTAVTLVNSTVLDTGMSLGLSKSNAILFCTSDP